MDKQQIDPAAIENATMSQNHKNDRSIVLSSNLTIVWRVFLPVFGTVFLAGFVAVFWFGISADEYAVSSSLWVWRFATLGVLALWLVALFRFLWPLKRVEADDYFVFISDYWHTLRYPWSDVEDLYEKKGLFRTLAYLELKAPGRFGQVIRFVPGRHFHAWLDVRKEQPV